MSIASKLQKILDSKAAIKDAIDYKGGIIDDNTPLDEYAELIRGIGGVTQKTLRDKVQYMRERGLLDITLKGETDYQFKEGNNVITVPAGTTHFTKLYAANAAPQINLFYGGASGSYRTQLVRVDAQPNGTQYAMATGSASADALEYMCAFYATGGGYTLYSDSLKEYEGIYIPPRTAYSCWFGCSYGHSLTHDNQVKVFIGTQGLDMSMATNVSPLFYNAYGLERIEGDCADWELGSVTNMSSMFDNCSSLQVLDVSGWDVGAVTNMQSMFNGCSSLQTLDVSGWDVGAVTNMQSMFNGCSSLQTLDVSGWDVSAVTNMQSMFGCPSVQVLDVSGWDVSAVTNMQSMFGCPSVQEIDLGFKTTACENMAYMFPYNGIPKIKGIDCIACTNMTGFNQGGAILRHLSIKNLGAQSSLTSIAFKTSVWGVNSAEVPDADWSLQYTIDNAFDRAAAGYPTCTLSLNANVKNNVMTSAQIAQLTAKGFTVA